MPAGIFVAPLENGNVSAPPMVADGGGPQLQYETGNMVEVQRDHITGYEDVIDPETGAIIGRRPITARRTETVPEVAGGWSVVGHIPQTSTALVRLESSQAQLDAIAADGRWLFVEWVEEADANP